MFYLNISYNDYEWRKTKESDKLYELVKWQEYNGRKSCYVIVFISYNEEKCLWEINQNNMSNWLDIPEEDIITVTNITKSVIKTLNQSK